MADKGAWLPIFRRKMSFGVGRGVKAFFGLYGGATRGEVPEPWLYTNAPKVITQKNRKIYRLRKQIKAQREDLSQLRARLSAAPSAPGEEGGGTLPDFVVIGAMRGGTTQFYMLLTKHPLIRRAASKELHFFDDPDRYARGIEWYRGCFPPPMQKNGYETITGEATPRYLLDPLAPQRMAEMVPDAKLFVLLRNPIDRAYSQYTRWARRGMNVPTFEEAVEEELAWMADEEANPSAEEVPPGAGRGDRRFYLLERGIYADQLERWREFVDEEQMFVTKSEDFYSRPADTLKQAQAFLGLPYREIKLPPRTTSRPTEVRYEPMNPALRRRLEAFFEPHNQRLYDLLGRDFGW
jgi:hypothetical protein